MENNSTQLTTETQSFKKPPDNYLVWAILTTIFCCQIIGIVSIVKSSQVNSKFAAGDYEGAKEASAQAKKWAIITFIVGIVLYVLVGIFYGVVIYTAIMNQQQFNH